MLKALITEDFHSLLADGLRQMGIEVDECKEIDYDGVLHVIAEYDILIVNSKIRINEELLRNAKKLRLVGRIGSGQDIFDQEACDKYAVATLTSPEGNANAVAEHILGFILSVINHQWKAQDSILRGEWLREDYRGMELNGKTLAIIGFGHNGKRLAELLSGFDLTILAYDIKKQDCQIKNVIHATLDQIYEQADIVSLHLPLDEHTLGFADQDFFDRFQKPIYYINCSRGKISPWQHILQSLDRGIIRAAMLDVFEIEPPILTVQIQNYVKNGRLFLTPHIAGWTHESKQKLAEIMLYKIKKQLSLL